jgi:hypothetical protein
MSKRSLAVAATSSLLLVGSAWGAPLKTPRRITVKVGESQVFTRTVLRPGATVRCSYRGHTLTVKAPTGAKTGSGAAWPGLFHLNVSVKPGGAYAVDCGLGGVTFFPGPAMTS